MPGRVSASPLLEVKVDNPERPYNMGWMDSCYQETLLPGAPWHLVNEEICEVLASHLHRQMTQPVRASLLARLLGDVFMAKYFPDVLTSLSHQAGDLPPEDERRLGLEASNWLKNQLLKAAREVGSLPDSENSELSDNMKEFVRQTSNVFYIGLNRELYKQERDMVSVIKEEKTSKQNPPPSPVPYQKLPNIGERSQDAASPVGSTTSSLRTVSAVSTVKTERVKAAMYNLDRVPRHPSMTSKSIDLIAESVVKLLERSPRRFATVAKRLHGRLLPSRLRTYIWTECLYKAERDKLAPGANVERILRERFGKTVARNVRELKIPRPTLSPIHRLIENSVIEVYDSVPALAASKDKSMMKEALRALNILYTYDRTYEPYLIMWLFPLQVAFAEQAQTSGPEFVYELAMHLDILNSSLFMQWAQVYAIADLVMHHLFRNDRELHDHMKNISQLDAEISAQDFVIEVMQKERREAARILNKPSADTDMNPQELLSDPRIYIRKWIGEGFVSVLDTPSVLFVWDQLFLQDWSSTVMQDFTLVLLILLRQRFLRCQDHGDMRQVFLEEPCKLLVADIQKAWLLLHKDTSYLDIARCNRVKSLEELIAEQESAATPTPIPSAESRLPDNESPAPEEDIAASVGAATSPTTPLGVPPLSAASLGARPSPTTPLGVPTPSAASLGARPSPTTPLGEPTPSRSPS